MNIDSTIGEIMEIQNSVLTSGLNGIKRGMDNVRKDAQDIVNSGIDLMKREASGSSKSLGEGLDRGLVNLISDRRDVEAAAKVIQTEKNLVGTLLDVMA